MLARPEPERAEKARPVVTSEAERAGHRGKTDEALLADIAGRGERAAFAELFSQICRANKGIPDARRHAPDVAEEVAQEVMVTVWRKSARFDPARASAATWIYTIARNRRIDLHRRESRPEPDQNDPLFQAESPSARPSARSPAPSAMPSCAPRWPTSPSSRSRC